MRLIILILSIAFIPFQSLASEQVSSVGDYNLCIKSTKVDPSQNEMMVDFDLILNLNQGDGFALIPLPVKNSKDFKMVIEPTSDNNLVLFGFLRPTEEFSLCQVKQYKEKKSNIRILFKNIILPLRPSGRSEQDVAVSLLFEESYKKIFQENEIQNSIPHLTDIYLEFNNFQDSTPVSKATSSYFRRSINIDASSTFPGNVTVYLSNQQNETFLYWILGVMGILLGYFGAPKIISTPHKARFTLIICLLASLGAVGFFFGYLSEQQRFKDTTTIVTFGTAFGLLIGILISSVQYLFQYRSNERGLGQQAN